MQRLAALFAAYALTAVATLFAVPAVAQDALSYSSGSRTISSESWIEEWDAATGRWVKVDDQSGTETAALPTITTTIVNGKVVSESRSAARFARPNLPRGSARMLAQYGPFLVTSENHVRMMGATDSSTPRYFDAMLRDFPKLSVLEMVEAPGTTNDIANLALGRRIRAAGLETHVPRGGSVRSGAVELFLAGVTRTIDDGAQFAVHSWLDNHGREADDFASNDPAHRFYLDYYVEMGMSERRAREFYDMTNSVPHATALWLVADDMRYWLRPDAKPAIAVVEENVPAIAYLDVSAIDLLPTAAVERAEWFQLARIDSRLDSPIAFP